MCLWRDLRMCKNAYNFKHKERNNVMYRVWFFFSAIPRGILVSWPRIEPVPSAMEAWVPTTGQPRMSPIVCDF